MTRPSYRTALRAKGIRPIRRPMHTLKADGHIELLPVRGTYVHGGER